MRYEPTLPLTLPPPSRAITAIVARAHCITTGGLVIVVVEHQRRHHPPRPPSLTSSPSRGWLLHGAACHHRHPHHCRPPPTQPHQRWRPCRLASFSSPPCDPPPVAVAPSPPSRLPMAPSLTGMWRRCALPPGPSAAPARAPLVGIRTHCASAAVTLRRPAVYPPLLLGPPPPVGQRRRQHGDVDGRPWKPGAAKTTL